MFCSRESLIHFFTEDGGGKVFYKHFEDSVADLLQDPRLAEGIDYHFKAFFSGDKRLYGPSRSSLLWQVFYVCYMC